MTKRQRKEYLVQFIIYIITALAMLILIVTVLIMDKGNAEIKSLEESLGISSLESSTYSISIEYISMEERMSRYIDSLPVPKREVLREEKEVVEEEVVSISINYNNELSKRVEGMTPEVRNLNTSSYCACEECCGKTDGITASGAKATTWHTVAAGKGYKMGTIIYIPALSDKPNQGWFVVEDRGGAISDEKLDIYLDTHSEAQQYGRKHVECYIFEF